VTTVPDSNVRLARSAAARSARGAGRFALARLLLFVLDHVSKLDRKLLLLLVASPISACIIPAGPEFQDPAGVPDSPPYLVSESPDEGMIVVGDDPFSVTPGDVNVNDRIYVKWITEYPPNIVNVTNDLVTDVIQPPANGTPVRRASEFIPLCTRVNPLVTTHQIVAAISDRPFTSTGLLTTDSSIPPLLVMLTWQKTCPGARQQ
jgi:hypothetical protein